MSKREIDAIREIAPAFGFMDEEEFVRRAVEEKILDLKKKMFFAATNEIRAGLEKRGMKVEEVLEDFERFRREDLNSC